MRNPLKSFSTYFLVLIFRSTFSLAKKNDLFSLRISCNALVVTLQLQEKISCDSPLLLEGPLQLHMVYYVTVGFPFSLIKKIALHFCSGKHYKEKEIPSRNP